VLTVQETHTLALLAHPDIPQQPASCCIHISTHRASQSSQSAPSTAARRALRLARLPDPGALPAAWLLLQPVPGVPKLPAAAAAHIPPQLLGDLPVTPQLPPWKPLLLPGDLPRGVLTAGQAADATAGVTAAPLGTCRWGLTMPLARKRLLLQLRSPCLPLLLLPRS
jgi:hypothetical protein